MNEWNNELDSLRAVEDHGQISILEERVWPVLTEVTQPDSAEYRLLRYLMLSRRELGDCEGAERCMNLMTHWFYADRLTDPKWLENQYTYALCYYDKNDYAQARSVLDTTLASFTSISESVANKIYDTYNALGVFSRRQGDYSASLNYLNKALAIRDTYAIKDPIAYVNLMNVYEPLGEFDKALEVTLKALSIYEQQRDTSRIILCKTNLGYLYRIRGKYDDSRIYLNESINWGRKAGIYNYMGNNYSELAIISMSEGQFELGHQLFDSAQQYFDEDFYLAYFFYKKGATIMEEQGDLAEAGRLIEKGIDIYEKLGSTTGLYDAKIFRAKVALLQNKYQEAFDSLSIIRDSLEKREMKSTLRGFYPIYHSVLLKLGRNEEAQIAFDRHTELLDELYSFRKAQLISEVQTQYETEKIQADLLGKENELLRQQQRQRQLLNSGILLTIGFLAALGFLIYQRNQKRKKYTRTMDELKDQLTLVLTSIQRTKGQLAYEENPATPSVVDLEVAESGSSSTIINSQIEALQEELADIEAGIGMYQYRSQSNQAKMEQKLERLRAFQYSVFHDLKAPINRIRQIAHRLSSTTPNDEAKTVDQAKLQVQLYALEELIQGLSTLIDLERIEPYTIDFSLSDLLSSLAQEYAQNLRTAKGTFIFDKGLQVQGDRYLLRLVLTNLISNAIKYRHPDRSLVLEIKLSRTEETYALSIVDNGRGWPASLNDKIFVPFFRAGPSSNDNHGLGLYICQRIAERINGHITANSVEGQGAIFTVSWPCRPLST